MANIQAIGIGAAGSTAIISAVASVAMRILWMHDDVKSAIDAPRIHNRLKPNTTLYEHGISLVSIVDNELFWFNS
jgi:gamma-glutamyltranspeptidase